MTKIFALVLLAFYASASLAEGYLDGNKLLARYEAKKRMVQDSASGLAADSIDAGFYIGYVQGAAESLANSLCLPANLSASRAESHPGKRKEPASFLVRDALAEAYPCTKK
ncbi:MAG TPA: Rap1a/Tai family immunity protein [Burkholderiales bacterium]|nr:Rap1a/Tai family immunity protein [Burkholderiales bacterium]